MSRLESHAVGLTVKVFLQGYLNGAVAHVHNSGSLIIPLANDSALAIIIILFRIQVPTSRYYGQQQENNWP